MTTGAAEAKWCQLHTMPSLNLSHYGVLLTGYAADPENWMAVIPPIFQMAFLCKRNLCSWEICGAVPLTCHALVHRSVHHELLPERDREMADPMLTGLEVSLEESCKSLHQKGHNGDAI